MKNYRLQVIGAVCALAITSLFSSCSKDNGISAGVAANVMIVNSAEGSSPQDFYSDTNKVNATAVAYTQNSGYLSTSSGNHTGQFRTSGTSTVNASSSFSFDPGQYYTVYLTGNSSSDFTVASQDDMSAPPAGKAKIRFAHLSSAAAGSIDFGIATGAKLVTGLAYRAVSAYNTIDASTSISLFASGSTTAFLTIPATFQAGKIYTVYISGATATTVSFHVITQN